MPVDVYKCGLVVSKKEPTLACTPDEKSNRSRLHRTVWIELEGKLLLYYYEHFIDFDIVEAL